MAEPVEARWLSLLAVTLPAVTLPALSLSKRRTVEARWLSLPKPGG